MTSRTITSALILTLVVVSASWAAEHAHEGHGATTAQTIPPAVLSTPPASGKARESGYDGNDMMESTTVENIASVECTQAARGLIMLDRAATVECTSATPSTQALPAVHPAPQPQPAQHQH